MLVTLGLAPWAVGLMIAAFLFICVILVLTVLIQRPQGGGLSGAFGSNSGSGQTAFGAKTGDALTIATIGMFVIYVLAAVGLNFAVKPQAPAAAAAPAVAATTPATTTPADGSMTPIEVPTGAVPTTPVDGASPLVPEPVTPPPAPEGSAPPPTEPAPSPDPGATPIVPAPTPNPTPAPTPPPAEPAPATPPGSGA